MFDYGTPIEETVRHPLLTAVHRYSSIKQMQALQDVVQAGNVKYFSMYSCYAYQCTRAIFLPLPLLTLSSTRLVHIMQRTSARHVCFERVSNVLVSRLCHSKQAHVFHLDAESLQSSVAGRGT